MAASIARCPRLTTPIRITLKNDYHSIRASLSRYVVHDPKAWNAEFEPYTRIRYSWTLSAEWPRLAMVQSLIGRCSTPIRSSTMGAHPGTDAGLRRRRGFAVRPCVAFQERMQFLAKTHPQRQRPAPSCFPASATCRISRHPRKCCHHWSRSSRRDWRRRNAARPTFFLVPSGSPELARQPRSRGLPIAHDRLS